MVLTRAQSKTGTAEPPKKPSARATTSSSRARSKPKEDGLKTKTNEDVVKPSVKEKMVKTKSMKDVAQTMAKEESVKPKAKEAIAKPKTAVSSRSKPEIAKTKKATELKFQTEETTIRSRRVASKPPVIKATKTIRKPVANKTKESEKPQTLPEPSQEENATPELLPISALQLSPIKSIFASPTKTTSPIKLSGSTILQTPRRSKAIQSAVKKLPFENIISETPHHDATTIHESPRRGNTIRAIALKLTTSEMLPVNESPKTGLKSSLASFKLMGTPMRRAIGTIKAPQTISALSPQKRQACETPIRPRSAQAEKKFKITTPQRPHTAEMIPNSCMKRDFTSKKSVTFDSSKAEISPVQHIDSLQMHIMTPITEKSGERSSLSFGVLDSVKSLEADRANAVLGGLVFYLDVWGSDGSSANEYFEPLLEEMGAKVVSEWSDAVTHVLFKDGSNTTLNRVIQSGVHCVNVGWAVDCEQRRIRLPEHDDQYAIDLGLEQEMFRTPLRQVNSNTTSPMIVKTPGTVKFGAELQALRDAYPKMKTPDFGKENWDSPTSITTPLLQKSCPAKQTNRAIFEHDPAASSKKSLFKTSRKSLGTALKMTWEEE